MKKKLLIIIVVITVITVILGTMPAPYKVMKSAIESVKMTSYDLTADISAITIAYFAITDFARKADGIEVEFYYRTDATGNMTGESGWVYRSWDEPADDPDGLLRIYMREEIVTVTPRGWIYGEEDEGEDGGLYSNMYQMCLRAIAPVEDLLLFDRNEEEEWGFFERIFNTIRLTVLSIQTIIFAVVLTIVDTVSLVWEFISAGFKIIGVSS